MAIDIMGSSLDKLDFSNLKLPDLSSGIASLQKAYPTKEQTIESLKNQILSQGTTSKWSGEGFGSPEANAKNMAEILQGIGITDIRQFGQVDKYEPVTLIGYELNGKRVQNPSPGVYYYLESNTSDESPYLYRVDLTAEQAKDVKPVYGIATSTDEFGPVYTPVDSTTVREKDGQLQAVTGKTYGNKVTGQVVPNTYSERQTGNAWGGTFAGSGNTGYRVEFAPDGTPYFYTTGASSKDSFFSDIAPILGLGLMFVPGMQGISASIGSALAPAASAAVQAGIGNAIVQGVMSEATGGDFLKGAALSGIGSLAGGLQPGFSEALGGGAVGDIASKALIGGTMSELSGGDFAQGALISGIGAGIDQAKLSAADDYLSSLPGGHGPYSDAPVDMSDFDVAPPVIDTTFAPDYSLSVGAPVIPEMGAQGIQVPTINEVIDVVNQPVDYSLPIPGSGIGLVMPTAPNLDSMGGGQGITVPVSGGTLTEAGVIPETYVPVLGDEQSFINQPAPNVEIVIPESPAPQQDQPTEPKDISSNLAILDVVKALVPTLVTAAIAEQVQNKQEEPAQTGFPILPVPSDWRSPEYSMAFTPSVPIDFGTRELLRGTQFENPQITAPNAYSLSNLINTLNMGSVPFVQQNYEFNPAPLEVPDILQQFNVAPTVGMTDIIGNLNNQPVSISDIIAGIQSGQNYSI